MDSVHNQPLLLAVVGRVEATGQRVAVEDREHVVAELPTLLGDVDLDAEAKPEELLGPGSVGDQVVEGGEKSRARLPGAGPESFDERDVVCVHIPLAGQGLSFVPGDLRFDHPAVARQCAKGGLEAGIPASDEVSGDVVRGAHAQATERSLDGQGNGLANREAGPRGPLRREPALEEIPDARLALPPDDGDGAAHPEVVEHARDLHSLRPPGRAPGNGCPAREVASPERAMLPQLREYLAAESVVCHHPVPHPLMPHAVPFRVGAHQGRLVNRIVQSGDDRGGVRPELEELPPAPEQGVEDGRIVVPDTASEDELMRSCDDIHRV